MIEYKTLTAEDIEKLKKIVPEDHPTELFGFKLSPKYEKIFLYPTNDVCLYEDQFNILKEIAPAGDRINIVENGNYSVYSPGNTVYVLTGPFSFSEYESIWLDSVTMIYPDSMKWILLTDEELYFGWGIFCTDKDTAKKIRDIYPAHTDSMTKYTNAHISNPKVIKVMTEFLK